MYSLVVVAEPAIEPVTLAEAKAACGISSDTLGGNTTITASLAPAARPTGSYTGASVDNAGHRTLIVLDAGMCGAGGTVTVTVQESNDNVTFTTVTSPDLDLGAFPVVTTANDDTVYQREYLVAKRYLRVSAVVAGATCSFGVAFHQDNASSDEDDTISRHIASVRQKFEQMDGRRFIKTDMALWLDAFPSQNKIVLPVAPLLAAPAVVIKYYGTDNTEYTMNASDYYTDAPTPPEQDPWARHIYLGYGKSWPSMALREFRAVRVEFSIGYGTTAADVPHYVKEAIENTVAYLYTHRGDPAAELDAYISRIHNSWPERRLTV